MKVLFVANVDFALRHFVLPLMRAARERGHEVVGACAEGPLLDAPRAEGFRIVGLPMARSLSPRANWRALRALRALIRAEKPDLVHGHFPISGLLARLAATLLAAMYATFVLILHAPRVAATPTARIEWTMLFIALSLTGAAWIVRCSIPPKAP